ncbi:hypothetical protein MLD38_000831 [Melastoma candidum]|uniref:Uncharacterized protein n=1 Tax=Melastoma candidum TaxID=119954 RepID=A0ACB9SBC3_9MYRT|nr:hypothetical protein MLD38_000831 [Melastoma candidum]
MDPYKYRPSSAHDSLFWTTNSGAPVYNNNSSLTVGTRGPILLDDYHLLEKLANFDRERIPERVVIIEKENNFKQPGERYRSWDSDRQERFVRCWVDVLSDPRVTHEMRSIWISYWSQCITAQRASKHVKSPAFG